MFNMYSSKISGFYKLSIEERLNLIKEKVGLDANEINILKNFGYYKPEEMDILIENVIASYQLPYSIACNFKINGKDYLIPMVIEEPSVVAAASNVARMTRKSGGFHCDSIKQIMIGQVQIVNINDVENAVKKIEDNKEKLIKIANEQDPILVKLGGGAVDLEIRPIETIKGPMIIIHLLVNVLDAMGANAVNTMAEAVAHHLEELTNGEVYLRIISNLATHRMARCKATFDKDMLGGPEVVEGILYAYAFAKSDVYRASTHNKGIMNGIIALTLATGNDTRAIEAGAHTYASLNGYSPLSKFSKDSEGNLVGELELPLALGIIGGLTKTHPLAKISLKILGIDNAEELAQIAVALGLCQNVAALRALASEGIQAGHMRLHKRKEQKKIKN
ncbi:MAG: hydroxymethylglutaryl-CoA reductase, degradative [Candidatus Lokiarchaeota archaeon]|nr:hydroxymethylglutaryl-CoA reductase, degradative [Candidatus Lokiarchaeota archaeon]MBD3199585.1 hydroxymethylglutaryl-CoA reductase, degradative [Candidatus Lokiarchaeota archaeon]